MSIRIDCCVNIKNSLIKLVSKKWHLRCSTKCLLRFVYLILSKLSRMTHWWEDKICKLIMQHYKSAKKRLKTHLRSLQHCRARDNRPLSALCFVVPRAPFYVAICFVVCGRWCGVCSYMVQYSSYNNNFKILWCLNIGYEFLWPSTCFNFN